ncbi:MULTISPECIES: hypothetical protein [unclassified Clostridium]|jgi:hypothetical protein|uniref:hypothetical protein n=1 Tax=Clostridium TaxID=1485 RepID=UPI001C8C1B50|nr:MULTISPECIES: hypothetical protein [unclassified Clostridium]MBX9137216.1 hypothetical protein [Clostridium sp. K12(2020)]MBX9143933.1 hypothetical protein [Clostridium sp. K13]MDU4324661.1 hypothetical protein [Clostridium celatum]
MEQILVTKGLNELKLLDSRINRKIEEGEFIAAAKLSVQNVNGKITKEAYKANAKADYQSIVDLIKRRNNIKSAIIQSNAVTKVDIAGKIMTVAEAIDKKSSIEYEISLLEKLTMQYKTSSDIIIKENEKVDYSIEQLLNTAYGKEGKEKITQASYDAIAEPYRKANEYGLVDALDGEKLIKEMKDKIERFLSEVDTALQISNSTTIINIE